MSINRLLEPVYEALETRLRRFVSLPLRTPRDAAPLVKLEEALRSLVMEVSVYLTFHGPMPMHLRQCAASPVSGDGAAPSGLGGLSSVQRHDARTLFWMVRRHAADKLLSLDELARILGSAPPEWAFLLAPSSMEAPGEEDPTRLRHRVWEGFAGEYVRDYLWLTRNPQKFDPDAARLVFERLEERIQQGRHLHLRVTPLAGLWLDGQEISLSPRLRLRPVTDFERHLWLNPENLHSDLPVRGMDVLTLTSVIEYEESPEERQDLFGLFNLLNPQLGPPEAATLAALKLLTHTPTVHVNYILPAFMERRSEGSVHESEQRCSLTGLVSTAFHNYLKLSEEQRQQLKPLVERLIPLFTERISRQLTVEDRSLSVALNRWLGSFHRTEPKDWLIDCWVALEGLFTVRGESGLTEKCAARVSQELVTLGVGSRKELYQQVRASYEVRCEIVHGEREAGKEYSDIAWRTRSHLSLILRHRLLRAISGAATTPVPSQRASS